MNKIADFIKSNPMFASVLLGIVGVALRNIPLIIIRWIRNLLFAQLEIESMHRTVSILEHLRKHGKEYVNKNFLCTNIDMDKLVSGYGLHLFKYNKRLLFVWHTKLEKTGWHDEFKIRLITHKYKSVEFFNNLFKECNKKSSTDTNFELYRKTAKECPVLYSRIPKRSFDNIIMPEVDKNRVLSTIDKFLASEKWYMDRGIPYQLGILLYGPPGTGKSSLIKAIVSYIGLDALSIDANGLALALRSSYFHEFKDKVCIIEDIDSTSVVHDRANLKNESSDKSEENGNLSDVLNFMDGVYGVHGRILLISTNHIEKLDPALIRPGRVDLCLEMGYTTPEMFEQFVGLFYPEDKRDLKDINVHEKIPVSVLQNMCLEDKSLDDIIEYMETCGK